MCARRREDVGERGAKLTDLLWGREGEGGGDRDTLLDFLEQQENGGEVNVALGIII